MRDLVAARWQVEADGKLFRNPGAFHFNLTSGIDWFELHGRVEYGETSLPIPRLLNALKRRENTVLLDDGSYGMLPEDWLGDKAIQLFRGYHELLTAEANAFVDDVFARAPSPGG